MGLHKKPILGICHAGELYFSHFSTLFLVHINIFLVSSFMNLTSYFLSTTTEDFKTEEKDNVFFLSLTVY